MIQVSLDKARTLKYGIGAVRDLENALGGKPLGDVIRDLSRLGINALVISLYHGLKHEDAGLNLRLIEKMLEAHLDAGESLQPLYDAVSESIKDTGIFRTGEDAAEGKSRTPIPA